MADMAKPDTDLYRVPGFAHAFFVEGV